jgi:glycosyltransferase involved in cell wall biosynthesis
VDKEKDRALGRKRVAIVYHFFAHYREPIAKVLCAQLPPEPEYVLVSDTKAVGGKIKPIDPHLAEIPVEAGGLRWRFIHNFRAKGFYWQTGLIGLAMSRKFDVIIYLGVAQFLSTWPSAILARLCGKRVLMWSHGFYGNEGRVKAWVRKAFYGLAHGMLLYGNWSRQIMVRKGFRPDRLYVIFNSLDYHAQCEIRRRTDDSALQQLRQNLFSQPDLPVLVITGRLTPQKSLGMLLDAASILEQRGVKVNLLFIGDGPEADALKARAKQANRADQTIFYGPCYDEETLGPLIMASDICVVPGAVGLTAMHAMVYGTPVITHNEPVWQMPEFEAIVAGKTGDFFRRGDVEDLATTIQSWLSHSARVGRQQVRADCVDILAKYYNPDFQARIINEAVKETPADALPLGEEEFQESMRRLAMHEARK